MDYLSAAQMEQLLRQINARRVSKDGKGFSHVEAYDIRAHLIRIFGFGRWSEEVVEQVCTYETEREDDKRTKWNVGYRSVVRLTVYTETGAQLAIYTEGAFGDVSNYPSRGDAHDMALKTSQSQALKRCAVNLGDQFGLSLYNRGSTTALVKVTLVSPPEPAEGEEPAESVDSHIEELAPENEPEPDNRERSTKPEREAKNKPLNSGEETSSEPPDEMQTAVDNLTEEFPGATEVPAEVSEKELVIAEIGRLVGQARELAGDEALQILKHALEMAVKRGVRQHRLSNGETIGASLTAMMAKAAGK